MIIETNAASELVKAKELLEVFADVEEKASKLKASMRFLTTKDVMELTGLSKPTVLELFKRPDFPICDYGHGYIVFAPAFYDYFMKAVKQSDFGGRR